MKPRLAALDQFMISCHSTTPDTRLERRNMGGCRICRVPKKAGAGLLPGRDPTPVSC